MQKTKIVATLGPVSESPEQIADLVKAGVDVFRLNFSHGTHKSHARVISHIQALEKATNKPIPIILDTKGPEIRTADIRKPIELKTGDTITFTTNQAEFLEKGKIGVNYDEFPNDVSVGDKILIDSGVMNAKVTEISGHHVICKVLDGGLLKSRRHLNLPGKHVSLEPVTDQDWADITFGIEQGVDFIAQSFVREASDVKLVKDFLTKHNAKDIDIIAKIETREAYGNIDAIAATSDSLMVARGDLGSELPYSEVPQAQADIIAAAEKHQKAVIIATQMLESMTKNPIPTRAEVTDVSMAVFQRADATMLSGETAGGDYPIKAVESMSAILAASEQAKLLSLSVRDTATKETLNGICKSVAQLANDLEDISAIMVLSWSGKSARLISSFRPNADIYAFSSRPRQTKKMQLLWGTESFMIDFDEQNPEKTVQNAKTKLLKKYPKLKGQKVILLSGSLVKGEFISTVQIREL